MQYVKSSIQNIFCVYVCGVGGWGVKRNEEKSYHIPHSSNIQHQMAKQTNSVNVFKLIGCYSYIIQNSFVSIVRNNRLISNVNIGRI